MIARLLRLERSKWAARRDVRGGMIFLLVGVVAYAALLRAFAEANVQLPAVGGVEPSGFHVAYRALRALLSPLALLLVLWSAGAVAAEVESGTARAVLLRAPRATFVVAKGVLLAMAAAAVLLGMLVGAVATGAITYGLHDVRAGSVTLHSAGSLLATGALASLMTVLPLVSLLALGLCASCVARSQAAAQTLAIVAATGLWAASLVPAVEPWSFASTFGRPLAVAISHSEGLRTESLASGLLHHCAVNLGWTVLLAGCGIARLQRRDLP